MQSLLSKALCWIRTNALLFIVLFFLSGVYFSLRLIAIRNLPLFTDEAIYIRWAQMGFYDAAQRLTSLSDGKQPLFIWLITLFMQGTSNPLTAGRIVSVLTGFITGIGLYFLSFTLFKNKWGAVLAVSFYVIFPFALVYDRMALYESTSGMFLVWSLLLGIILTNTVKFHMAFILALVLGGGILTKTTGFLSIYLLPLLLFLLPVMKKDRVSKFMTWVSQIGVAIGLSLLYYSLLQLSPQFSQINEKNAIFLYHVSELVRYDAFSKWLSNILTLIYWLAQYMSIPTFVIFLTSFYVFREHWREKVVLFLWCAIPFIGYGLFSRSLNPRYIFPIILPLLPLFAANITDAFHKTKLRKIIVITIAVCIVSMLYVDNRIITSFASSPIPQEDLEQYINGTAAGGGIRESVRFLLEKAQQGPLYIATEGIYGSLPTTAMELYFLHHPSVQKSGFSASMRVPKQLIEKTYEMPVYLIFNQTQSPPAWPMKEIAKYPKGSSNTYLRLYQLQKISLTRCQNFLQDDQKTMKEECE